MPALFICTLCISIKRSYVIRMGNEMQLTFDQRDAICEISNISVGAAACYISNITASDVDISVPHFWGSDKVSFSDSISTKSLIYKMEFTSFMLGYFIFEIEDDFDYFCKMMDCSDNKSDHVRKNMNILMENSILPLERLMEQSVIIERIKDFFEDDYKFSHISSEQYVGIVFDMCVDNRINGKITYVLAENIAKNIANKFIDNGVALTTV